MSERCPLTHTLSHAGERGLINYSSIVSPEPPASFGGVTCIRYTDTVRRLRQKQSIKGIMIHNLAPLDIEVRNIINS
jgi:hypothetical protein